MCNLSRKETHSEIEGVLLLLKISDQNYLATTLLPKKNIYDTI